MKRYIIAALCVFLVGCSAHKVEIENTATSESINTSEERADNESSSMAKAETASEESEETKATEEMLIKESSADINFHKYSGEWIFLNNADMESEGGVSLSLTISGQIMEAKLSAWSSNYNRLADADLSGIIQDNKADCRFDDDGRGHSGVVQLTLEDDRIQMEIVIDKDSANGDFTFPEGTTILQRKDVRSNPAEREPIESDNAFPLSVDSADGPADFYVSFNDTYEALKKRLNDSAASGGHNSWEEYTEYTVLNKKDMWPLIQNEADYMKYASIMYTMIEPVRQNTLIFIEDENSAPLCSALTSSPNVMSEKGIRCGDTIEDIKRAYGKSYRSYATAKNVIYEYKTLKGYLRFLLDPESKTVTEWGIDKYSFEDRTNVPH